MECSRKNRSGRGVKSKSKRGKSTRKRTNMKAADFGGEKQLTSSIAERHCRELATE